MVIGLADSAVLANQSIGTLEYVGFSNPETSVYNCICISNCNFVRVY